MIVIINILFAFQYNIHIIPFITFINVCSKAINIYLKLVSKTLQNPCAARVKIAAVLYYYKLFLKI